MSMGKEQIFEELDKRINRDLIISCSEVRTLSGLSDKDFGIIFLQWYMKCGCC